MMGFEWASSWAFFLFLPLLMLCLWALFQKKKGSFFYSSFDLLPQQSYSLRLQFLFLPFVLKIVSLFFLIIALARPQIVDSFSRNSQEGLDIMLVMDISLSMLVEDMSGKLPITRLVASQTVVREFIKKRNFDRMGLIAFSGESFTKVPLTYDYELLKSSLSQLDVDASIEPGTAIGVALANSVARLKSSPSNSRVIIFLTDGENNTGFIDPETALDLVKKNDIKVYTVGLGQRSGDFLIRYKTQEGVYRKARISSHINTELLQKISKETNGEFFMANDFQSLQKVFDQIDKLETYEIKTDEFSIYEEHFQEFLWLGFLFYLISVFLSLSVFFRGF